MATIDKAAIVWSIAIVAIAIGIASVGQSFDTEISTTPIKQEIIEDTKENTMNLSSTEIQKIAEDAYIYGYPLVSMDITMIQSTNVVEPIANRAPVNQFTHVMEFPDADWRAVVRPNADTLYSLAWLDLSDEPLILHVPDTDDRYYLLPMINAYTDVFESPGKRTTGTGENDFIITGPFWNGEIPDDVIQIQSPTNMVWIIGRTQTNGPSDYESVNNIQEQFTLTPLSYLGKEYTPPQNLSVDSEIDMSAAPGKLVDESNFNVYFNRMALLMKDNPPADIDAQMIENFAKIGIVPGDEFNSASFSSEILDAIEQGAKSGLEKVRVAATEDIGFVENGWQRPSGLGAYGTDYLYRAAIAMYGIGANLDEDAHYPVAFTDGESQRLNGQNDYVIHFANDQIPPVNAFWSVTMYDGGFFYDNELDRYAIGDRDDLKFNDDGSLDIYIQHESPEGFESNWLPSPEGDFDVVMRTYWPQESVLDGTWKVTPIQKIE